jgi:hypothetical protein
LDTGLEKKLASHTIKNAAILFIDNASQNGCWTTMTALFAATPFLPLMMMTSPSAQRDVIHDIILIFLLNR